MPRRVQPLHDQQPTTYMHSRWVTKALPLDDFRGIFGQGPPRRNITHAVESTPPFEEGSGNECSDLKMEALMSLTSLLSENPSFEHRRLVLDVAITIPCAPSALDASVDVVASALTKANWRNFRHYMWRHRSTYKLVPLAFSVC